MSKVPTTLREAVIHFADPENCHKFMVRLRWPDGEVRCPHCGSDDVEWLPNARVFKCYQKHPRQKFSLKVGTVFEDSPIGLDKWFPVMWMLVNSKNGISSWEIHRAMGVTQKTAWFMLQRGRLAMQDPTTGGKLSGEVEVDETFIGGKARFMHKDRNRKRRGHLRKAPGPWGKAIVAAVLERGGKVRAQVIERRKKRDMHAFVKANVESGSNLYTDDLKSYDGLDTDYQHQAIDHAQCYVDGQTHTNNCENFWTLLKRGLKGTYVSVEPFHLFRYIDEQAYRFNERKATDAERFDAVMKQVLGRRLTYQELIGKTEGASLVS